MKNGHTWRPRLIAGVGSLVLMLGILIAFQAGTSRSAAPARTGAVTLRASGALDSRVVTTSYAQANIAGYCTNGGGACLNAWGGGPWVNVYTRGPDKNDSHADFQEIAQPGSGMIGYSELEYTGGGTWSGDCVGDASNKSGNADTSLDSCGTTKTAPGWGTLFDPVPCTNGGTAYYNVHWKGWLGPVDKAVNGSHFYLNKPSAFCFSYISG